MYVQEAIVGCFRGPAGGLFIYEKILIIILIENMLLKQIKPPEFLKFLKISFRKKTRDI